MMQTSLGDCRTHLAILLIVTLCSLPRYGKPIVWLLFSFHHSYAESAVQDQEEKQTELNWVIEVEIVAVINVTYLNTNGWMNIIK